MQTGRLNEWAERARDVWARAGAWLGRAMPRVVLSAAALLVLWVFLSSTSFNETRADNILDVITFLAVFGVALYYGMRALLWAKRKLLWRVRRRLIITYLFVGLTPVLLLGLLALIASVIFTGQAMSRIVNVQVDATRLETLASARTLADALATLPATADERTTQRWLDERTALLQAWLPGARVSVWRGGAAQGGTPGMTEEELNTLGHGRAADFVTAPPAGEEFRGVGLDQTPEGAALPEWLRDKAEWSGFAFTLPPDGTNETFGTPSLRALVRRRGGGRSHALLLVVPVSRALIQRYRETTGIHVRPFFVGSENLKISSGGGRVKVSPEEQGESAGAEKDYHVGEVTQDQLGDPVEVGGSYLVVLPATAWANGISDTRIAFIFNFSWLASMKQLMWSTAVGEMFRQILFWVAVVFLVLELLALLAAGWMTRAVTGTVHKLYRATEFINRGDFSHRIRVRSRDQLGELAVAFNEMSSNIEALLSERVEHERLKREIEIAHEVQAQLFPRSVPRLESAALTGECRAARGVAGDYYDYIEVEPGLVAFTLGDVSGKGVSAALVMSNLQAALRAQITIIVERRRIEERAASLVASTAAVDLADPLGPCGVTGVDTACAVENMVTSINQQLCRSTDSNRFATLFLALYDDGARRLRYTNAGHNAPLLVRTSGEVERLTMGGTIVGAFDFAGYEEAQVSLAPGDVLVVFSDGISEAQNATGEEYGEERIVQFAADNRHMTAENLRQTIFEEVDEWTGAVERGDDQTLVILKVKE